MSRVENRVAERRSIPKVRLRVVHLHRSGDEPVRRVSQLLFVGGRPVAVLGWSGTEGERRPKRTVPLETSRLRPSRHAKHLYRYEGVTVEAEL